MSKRSLMLDNEKLNEKFASKKQQGYFYAKCGEGKTKEQKKWCKMAKEFSDDMTKKDWKKLPEKVKEESISEAFLPPTGNITIDALIAIFLGSKLAGVDNRDIPQYVAEISGDLLVQFVKFLKMFGYSVDTEVLNAKWDGLLKKAMGKFYKEGGVLAPMLKDNNKNTENGPLDENKIVSLIKEKENPRMTKKDLLEYVKSKKVVKKITKSEMIFEQGRDRDITDYSRWFEPRERRILNAYLLKLRDSGLENMFGVAPILNWTKDDLQRYLYGRRMDLESLESQGDYDDYWDEDEEEETERNDKMIEIIRYLLENKQEIRDILIRSALRRAEANGDDYNDKRISSYFYKAASDALIMYMKSFG